MARIRTVKPEMFTHDGLADADASRGGGFACRWVFAGLPTQADCAGRFLWNPRRLKVALAPYDDLDMGSVLDTLEGHGFVRSYEVDGERYGVIPTFEKHQRVQSRELKQGTRYPAPSGDVPGASPVRPPHVPGASPATPACAPESRNPSESQGVVPGASLVRPRCAPGAWEGKGKEGKGEEGEARTRESGSTVEPSSPPSPASTFLGLRLDPDFDADHRACLEAYGRALSEGAMVASPPTQNDADSIGSLLRRGAERTLIIAQAEGLGQERRAGKCQRMTVQYLVDRTERAMVERKRFTKEIPHPALRNGGQPAERDPVAVARDMWREAKARREASCE